MNIGDRVLINNPHSIVEGEIVHINNIPWGFKYVVNITKSEHLFWPEGECENFRLEDLTLINYEISNN